MTLKGSHAESTQKSEMGPPPHLRDLVLLFLRERYPYWKFRYNGDADRILEDERGFVMILVYDNSASLWHGANIISETIQAADPEFLEKIATHILSLKKEQIWCEHPCRK